MPDISDKTAMKALRSLAHGGEDYLGNAEKTLTSLGIIDGQYERDLLDAGFQQGSKKVNTLCLSVKRVFAAYMVGRNAVRAKKFSNYVIREMYESTEDKMVKMSAITSLQLIILHAEECDYPTPVITAILKNLLRCTSTHDDRLFAYANSTLAYLEQRGL
jgi:hypothetical protein